MTTTIAFLGPKGTYTHAALHKAFGSAQTEVPCTTMPDIFNAVEQNNADFGVVPFENSTEGPVNPVLDAFLTTELTITQEIALPIHHCLLAKNNDDIKKIIAHPQALAQCRTWLHANFPNAETIAASSNAQAAQLVVNTPNAAAIAGRECASLYNLNSLHEHIEDDATNTTRFVVIGKTHTKPTENNKTALLLTLDHRPGALAAVLSALAKHNINLTMIQSRPVKNTPWHYHFFIDIQGHQSDPDVEKALETLTDDVVSVKILGSFPAAAL